MIGQRMSHFRILSRIGEGGMGVVYRAEDESLQRTVALKVLSSKHLGEEERRLRFLREARAAAAITHANIATVHEVGESEGAIFIAMELVEGRTLRETIGGRPLPVSEVLRLGVELAEGLAAAHSAHIIHRDLKPDNVIVTTDGRVKILDFGLAKLLEERAASGKAEASKLATISEEMTQAGRVMGTAAYMSPEQARGLPADARSDLFSFGVVLYEMTTGKAPFQGSTSMDTLTAILREQPAPAVQLNPETPRELERIIGKCLEKEAGERYQDTRDLVVDLRHLKRDSDSQTLRRVEAPAPSARVAPRHGLWRWAGFLAAGAVVLAALALGGWRLLHRGAPAGAAGQFQSMKMTSLARINNLVNAALSPDGRFLAYIARQPGKYSLSIRQVSTGSDVQILPPQDAPVAGLTFSPDGDYLYFLSRDPESTIYNALFKVPALGGAPRKILFDVDSAVAFSPDGKRLAFVRGLPYKTPPSCALMVADADGANPRALATSTSPNRFVYDVGPSWSPDSQRIIAVEGHLAGTGRATLVEVTVADGRESHVGDKAWRFIHALTWLADGSGIAVIGGGPGEETRQVWFVAHPQGVARRITNDLNAYVGLSVSADGKTLATLQVTSAGDLWAAPANDAAAAKQITFGEGGARIPYLDPVQGGTQIAAAPSGSVVYGSLSGSTSQLWEIAPDRVGRRQLTPDDMDARFPLVARRAGTIAFTGSGADRIPHVYRMDPDGTDLAQVTRGDGEVGLTISPDGAQVIFLKLADLSSWKTSLTGGPPAALGVTLATFLLPAYSPDGRTFGLGGLKERAGLVRAIFEQFPAAGGAPLNSFEWPKPCEYRSPWKWAPSGDALTCIGELDGVYNLWRQPLAGGAPTPITHFKSGHVLDFDWSTDGKQLFLWRGDATTDVVLISGFK